jgi:alcohol dehydrogenase class IV
VTERFTWTALPSRVVFAPGALQAAPDEVSRLEKRRVLLVGGGASTRRAFQGLRELLENLVAGEVGG